MKKFVCSIVLVFAVALICAACGSAEKKSEQNQTPQWVIDWIKSKSSDKEICAVGGIQVSVNAQGAGVQLATIEAQKELCKKIAVDGNNDKCNLSAKMKDMRQSRDKDGGFTICALVCIDRKDLEENKTETSETGKTDATDNTDETDKTDEDKVVQ